MGELEAFFLSAMDAGSSAVGVAAMPPALRGSSTTSQVMMPPTTPMPPMMNMPMRQPWLFGIPASWPMSGVARMLARPTMLRMLP
jgi:hypothetical protein